MNASSWWLRPLQFLAFVLGIAIVALFVAWLRIDPLPPVILAPDAAVVEGGAASAVGAPLEAAATAPREATLASASPREVAAAASTDAVLYGTVKRGDGTPVNEGFFWLFRDGTLLGTASLRDGTFAFPGLQAGVHRLSSRIADELPIEREVLVVAPSTRLDVDLPARWLLTVNVVTADGAPALEGLQKGMFAMGMRNLRALAFREPLQGDLLPTSSNEIEAGLGSFRGNDPFGRGGPALPKQTLGVLALPPGQPVHVGLFLVHALIAQLPVSADQPEVNFVLGDEALLAKCGTVRLRCVDEQGAPVVGAHVSIGSAGGTSFGGDKMVTDDDGRYTATRLLPGLCSFGVSHKTLRMPPLEVVLAPGAELDLGDVALRPGVEVEITFDNFGGKGSVRAFPLDTPVSPGCRMKDSYWSAENGTSQKQSLFPGRYALLAKSASGVALLEIDTAALPTQPLRFDLQHGASLQIVNRVGAGRSQLAIATQRGVPVHASELSGQRGFALELPAGTYTATITDMHGTVTRRSIALDAKGASLTIP